MICGMTAKFCYQLSKSLSIYPPPHTTSSKLLLITRSTIPTLRVRIVRQRHRVRMSRQLYQRYAAAYLQQIILRSQPKRCCAQASDVIDHAHPIIFLRYNNKTSKSIPAHDHDPNNHRTLVCDTRLKRTRVTT